jgi:hypothetical protein
MSFWTQQMYITSHMMTFDLWFSADDGGISSFLPCAERSHSLAASLGFKTRAVA